MNNFNILLKNNFLMLIGKFKGKKNKSTKSAVKLFTSTIEKSFKDVPL